MELLQGKGSVLCPVICEEGGRYSVNSCETVLHEYPVSKGTGCADPWGDLIPNDPWQIIQPTPGDPGCWGCFWVELKTEHIAAGQKVLETSSRHSVLTHRRWSTALSTSRPGELRKRDSWAQTALNFFDISKCIKKNSRASFSFHKALNSTYPTEFLLIYTAKMRGKPNFWYLFGEIT